jgi:hypothetical protein
LQTGTARTFRADDIFPIKDKYPPVRQCVQHRACDMNPVSGRILRTIAHDVSHAPDWQGKRVCGCLAQHGDGMTFIGYQIRRSDLFLVIPDPAADAGDLDARVYQRTLVGINRIDQAVESRAFKDHFQQFLAIGISLGADLANHSFRHHTAGIQQTGQRGFRRQRQRRG